MNMYKQIFTIVLLFLSSITFSQNEKSYWESLLLNKREDATEQFKKTKQNLSEMEALITHELIRFENGHFSPEKDFTKKLASLKEAEYYIYAFWKETFLFDRYIESGFTKKSVDAIEILRNIDTDNQMVKEGLLYLKAVSERHLGNWDEYHNHISKMNSIRDWQFCGVFENLNNSGFDISYEPESIATDSKEFNANSNGMVNWYNPSGMIKESYKFFTNHSEYGRGVHYAQTFISSSEEKRVFLRIGNSSKFKIWLNDVQVFENSKDVITELDAYSVQITIPKGTSRLLIKNSEGNSSISYFIARITDEKGNAVNGLKISSLYSDYLKSKLEDINPVSIVNPIEKYFLQKKAEHPENFFYDYCLVKTYLRNGKYAEGKQLLLTLYKKYPKSSLLRKLLILCYKYEGDNTTIKEIKNNLKLDDPNYYLSLFNKFSDQGELSRMDVSTLKEFLDKLTNSSSNPLIKSSAKIMLGLRESNKSLLKKDLDEILKISKDLESVKFQNIFAPLYKSLLNDEETSIKIYENIHKNYHNYTALERLATYYEKLGKKDKALQLYLTLHEKIPYDNSIIKDLIRKLHKLRRYEESLTYIEKGLKNFPYSFSLMKLKGNALVELDKKEEAIAVYQQSLIYNNGDSGLRKKIQNISKQDDPLEKYKTKDIYDYITKNRNQISSNNYGYNILLDEQVTILYPEGGGKAVYNSIYEITSQNGVDYFKEYNLGLSSKASIIKTEIVKPDKSTVPADRSGSNLVFKGLEVGDVIYISYDSKFNGTGRFFKDFTDSFQFDSYHPCIRSCYTILVPENQSFNYKLANGEIPFKETKSDNYFLYEWTLDNENAIPAAEDYMSVDADIVRQLHISTIPTWNKIVHWYSDLVRSQIDINATVKDTFNQIFPNGASKLSDKEKAEKIYYYIMNTVNYSSVNFRQSGFIPQKPSKTIKTKLGDCKDVSTLFVTLADMADLDANLVLILTSDYGRKSLVLPSQDFNHCIVKVMLDGKEQYLELTDKFLPFKAMPTSLIGATALEIPYHIDQKKNHSIIHLDNVARVPAQFKCIVDLEIGLEIQKLRIDTEVSGSNKSYYAEVFEDPNYDVVKKNIYEDLKGRSGVNMVVDSVSKISYKKEIPVISFVTDATFSENINKIGSTKIYQLPNITNPYNISIIGLEERQYPIDYTKYENVDLYNTVYNLYLPENQRFTEIPEKFSSSFKKHHYQISYEKISENHLKVSIDAHTDYATITKEDYSTFKKYVKSLLEAEEAFIGFK